MRYTERLAEAGAVASVGSTDLERFNHRRLHGEIGLVPPVELETEHYRHNPTPVPADAALQSLHQNRGETVSGHASATR